MIVHCILNSMVLAVKLKLLQFHVVKILKLQDQTSRQLQTQLMLGNS